MTDLNYPDGGYGWIVLAGVCLVNMCTQSITSTFSLLFREHLENLDQQMYGAALLSSLNSIFLNFSGVDLYEPKTDNEIIEEEIVEYEDNAVILNDIGIKDLEDCTSVSSHINLKEKLQYWAISCNVYHKTLTKLLKILSTYGCLHGITDARTLLSTPTTSSKENYINNMNNGKYIHFGVEISIKSVLNSADQNTIENVHSLDLSFNIDGTPTSVSGGHSFWLILGCVNNLEQKVFVIGIFHGVGKPENFNTFLESFVNELASLCQHGLVHNTRSYVINIHSFLCDAPAMASIKQIKSHGGYYCCQKCFIKGEKFVGKNGKCKIVYPGINFSLRTDTNFRRRVNFNGEIDCDHHKCNRSILEELPISMVDHFPLDKMHLVDEGVCKKLIQIWLGKPNPQKLGSHQLQKLNKHLKLCYKYSCSEFQRKTRTLNFAAYMKASEFRVFLIYTGPIVLKGILNSSAYKHFLCLSLAVRILTSPVYYRMYNQYAADLCEYFVKHFTKIYGVGNMTYNVHCLLHLAKDVYNLGPLDGNSCYKFESYIKKVKSFLHSSYKPLEQCYNRISEINVLKRQISPASQFTYSLSKNMNGTNFYKICTFSTYVIKCYTVSDSCLMLHHNRQVIRVKFFEKTGTNIKIHCQNLYDIQPLHSEPIDLEDFFLILGKFKEEISTYELHDLAKDVLCKMCCMPYKNGIFFISPLNHTLTNL